MDVTRTDDGEITILGIAGEINFATSPALEQAVAAGVAAGRRLILLDLGAVRYVSSAGLRAILVGAKRAKAAGGGLAIFGLQPSVREVFLLSGFERMMPVVERAAQAREELLK